MANDKKTDINTKTNTTNVKRNSTAIGYSRKVGRILLSMLIIVALVFWLFPLLGFAILSTVAPRCINGTDPETFFDFNRFSLEYLRQLPISLDETRNVDIFERFFHAFADISRSEAIDYLKQINTTEKRRSIDRPITPIVSLAKQSAVNRIDIPIALPDFFSFSRM